MGYLARVFRASEEENRNLILEMLPRGRGGTLLDLGTHKGDFATRVAERLGAERTVGIEFLEEHARDARARGIEVIGADLEQGLPVDGQRFDVIHANQIVEHVRRTDMFMSEIRRALKPNGIACISTNNLSSWHNIFSLSLGLQPAPMHVSDEVILGNPLNPENSTRHPDRGRPHLRLFTRRSLCELAAHHDLEVVDFRVAGYYPLPPRLARLALRADSLHGAFLVGVFRRSAEEPATQLSYVNGRPASISRSEGADASRSDAVSSRSGQSMPTSGSSKAKPASSVESK
jgi:SAM-dependent methyltransferase